MAAVRISRNLIRLSIPTPQPPPPRFLTFRYQSNNATSNRINPIEDPEQPESDAMMSDLDHVLALRRIESAMHEFLVKKSTPGWLPLVPGGSYWVPPVGSRKSNSVAEMVEKLASSIKKEERNARRGVKLVRTERGWPSKAFYFKGASPHSIEMEINSTNKSEDEE